MCPNAIMAPRVWLPGVGFGFEAPLAHQTYHIFTQLVRRQITDFLRISDGAVNLYIANAKRKLGAATREQAVARAITDGMIDI